MEQKINIAEILKDAPKDCIFHCALCGDVTIISVSEDEICVAPIKDGGNQYYTLYEDGSYDRRGDCLLFPSKDNRDWSKLKAPWTRKYFKPLQLVLFARGIDVTNSRKRIWTLAFYSHYEEDSSDYVLTNGLAISKNAFIIAYTGNEDKLGKEIEV